MRRHRSLLSVICFVLTASALNLLGAVPALAGCPSESDWEVSAKSEVWMLTSAYSNWLAGPGTISYAESEAATRGTTQSVSGTAGVDYIIWKAEVKYQKDWTASTTKTKTWTYTVSVPSGQTARAAVYKRGSRFSYYKWSVSTACVETISPTYYQWSPYASNDNVNYCISKDKYPGTTWVYSSTGCAH